MSQIRESILWVHDLGGRSNTQSSPFTNKLQVGTPPKEAPHGGAGQLSTVQSTYPNRSLVEQHKGILA
jgi:hypothetical protein